MATKEENYEMFANVKRRYACPTPCSLNCVIEMTSRDALDPVQCPFGGGSLYDWIPLDETAGDERR